MIGDPALRKSVYASIVASLLVILFIQPILTLCGKALLWMGANIYEGISNSIYRQTALGLNESYSFLTLSFLVAGLIGLSLVDITHTLFPEGSRKKVKEFTVEKHKYLFLAPLFIFPFLFILFLAHGYASLQLNASFNQRLAVLASRISDVETKQIRANWASMQNRKDYELIVQQMERLAEERSVKLPRLLWQ